MKPILVAGGFLVVAIAGALVGVAVGSETDSPTATVAVVSVPTTLQTTDGAVEFLPSVHTLDPVSAVISDCPSGSEVTSYVPGTRVFAVGRTSDSSWIQIRDLDAYQVSLWVKAADLLVDDSFDVSELPVVACVRNDPITLAGSSSTTLPETTTTSEPDTSTTVPGTSTSTTSTSTTTTSTPPDTTPPSLVNPSATPPAIYELNGSGITCPPGSPTETLISVFATDDGGVDRVGASWVVGSTPYTATMSASGSLYTVTVGGYPYLSVPDNTSPVITVTLTATDVSGNAATTSTSFVLNSLAKCFV